MAFFLVLRVSTAKTANQNSEVWLLLSVLYKHFDVFFIDPAAGLPATGQLPF
jgi:hypothetical protein